MSSRLIRTMMIVVPALLSAMTLTTGAEAQYYGGQPQYGQPQYGGGYKAPPPPKCYYERQKVWVKDYYGGHYEYQRVRICPPPAPYQPSY